MSAMAIFHQRTALRQFFNIVDPKRLTTECVQFAILAMRKQEESNDVLMLEVSANSDVREERRRVNSLVRPQQVRPRFAAFACVTDKLVFPNFAWNPCLYHVAHNNGIWLQSLYHVADSNEIVFICIRDELATDHLDGQNPCVLKHRLVTAVLFTQRHSYVTCVPRIRRYAVSHRQYCEDCDTANRQKKPLHE